MQFQAFKQVSKYSFWFTDFTWEIDIAAVDIQ